jgi:hypothetical protein
MDSVADIGGARQLSKARYFILTRDVLLPGALFFAVEVHGTYAWERVSFALTALVRLAWHPRGMASFPAAVPIVLAALTRFFFFVAVRLAYDSVS